MQDDHDRRGAGPAPDATDRHRELLSALMDGEASEHELHQVLRALPADAGLTGAWQRYHLARDALRGGLGATRPALADIDLRSAIAARIDDEHPARGAARALPAWWQRLASVAVAAAVAAVTVVGWQALAPVPGGAAAVVSTPEAKVQTVALGPMVVVRSDGEELVLPEEPAGSPTAAQDRLNAYLARHVQAAGLGGAGSLPSYARVVSLEGEQAR